MMLNVSPKTLVAFGFIQRWVDPKGAPHAAIAAAGLSATLAEDCGPCTQIGVDMALANGLRPEVLRAILAGDEAAMGETAALAWRFARANLARDLESADAAREEIVRRWGERGLLTLSMAMTAGRVYPTLKYALGHGKACSRLTVAGEPVRFARPEPLAA